MVFSFWQIGSSINQKYQTRYLKSELQKEKNQNQQLKIEIAGLQSINRIEDWALKTEMVATAPLVYLNIDKSAVAVKK